MYTEGQNHQQSIPSRRKKTARPCAGLCFSAESALKEAVSVQDLDDEAAEDVKILSYNLLLRTGVRPFRFYRSAVRVLKIGLTRHDRPSLLQHIHKIPCHLTRVLPHVVSSDAAYRFVILWTCSRVYDYLRYDQA